MLLQHHQKRLYTITTTTTPQHPPALLDNLLPPDCSVRKLFQHIKLDAAADLDNTQFHPEQAAAAALIATGPGGGAVDDHHQLLLQRLRAANQTLFLIYWWVEEWHHAFCVWHSSSYRSRCVAPKQPCQPGSTSARLECACAGHVLG